MTPAQIDRESQGAMTTRRQLWGLLGWLLLVFGAAATGAVASAAAPDFYRELVRPAWAPPAWLFGPVWTVLYLMMAVAAWLVWRAAGGFGGAPTALLMFVAQLVLNAGWTWLFLHWRLGAAALADIVLLWLLIVATMLLFGRVQRLAALLLLPYLAWVTFAAALTHAIWRSNPALL